MLAFSTELLNYIIAFATQGKSGLELEQEHAPVEVRGDDFAECDVKIQNEAVEFEENMSLTVFRKGDLMVI